MSFSLYISELSPEQVSFGYSAAHETIIALHVFHDCKHHPLHIPWVINARRKIHSTLKQEIAAFSFLYKRPLVTFWSLQGNSAFQSFEDGLNELSSSSVDFFCNTIVETILNQRGTTTNFRNNQQLQQDFIGFACNRYPESREVIHALSKNPELVLQRFINMLEDFWRICVKNDWNMIEELFLKDIALR